MALTTGDLHTYSTNTHAFADLVTGADGRFYVAYKTGSTGIAVDVYDPATKTWSNAAGFTAAETGNVSLSDDLDLVATSDGRLHIAFKFDNGDGQYPFDEPRGVGYGEFDGTSWSFSRVDQGSNPSGWHNFDNPSLVVDGSGKAHIAYNFADATSHDYYVKYATNVSGSFASEVRASYTADVNAGINEIHRPILNMADNGTLHLTYFREDNINGSQGNPYYQSKASGSPWTAESQIDGTYGEINPWSYSNAVLDGDGNVHLFYASNGAVYDLSGSEGAFSKSVIIEDTENIATVRGYYRAADVEYLLVAKGDDSASLFSKAAGGSWQINTEAVIGSDTDFAINADGQVMIVTTNSDLRQIDFATGPVTMFVNAAPTASNLTQTLQISEDGGSLDLADIVVVDGDAGDAITASLHLSNSAAGALSTGTYGSATSTYNAGTGVWTVSGVVADVNAALAAVSFNSAANWDQDVTITTRVRDAANSGPADGTISLDFTSVNDAPVLTGGGVLTAIAEDVLSPSGAALNSLGIAATDAVDGGSIAGYAVVGNSADTTTQGAWQYSTNGGANWHAVGAVNDSGAALAISASTLVRFVPVQNFNGTPSPLAIRALDGNVTTFSAGDATEARVTIDTSTNGGESFLSAATAQISTSVTASNDAPDIAAPASLSVREDTASPLTGISFSDIDASAGSVTASFTISSGSLSATSGGGVTVGGTASALTLTGSIAAINTYLSAPNVNYVTAANATGDLDLTIDINDNGNTGSGGALTGQTTVSLQVDAVNDAPIVTAPLSISVDEDVTTPISGMSFSDVDAGASIVTATFSVPSGLLSASSGGGVGVTGSESGLISLSGTIANINAFIAAGSLGYTSAENSTSNVVLTASIDDGGNTGADPGTSGTATSEADVSTTTLVVTAVNDAPVNQVPSSQSVDQDSALVFSSANGNGVSVSDVDAGGGTLRVSLTASNGALTLSSTAGLSFVLGSGSGDLTMTFEGTLTDINAALDGMSFNPNLGYHGPASLSVVTSDLGLSGSGGTQTDADTIALDVQAPVVPPPRPPLPPQPPGTPSSDLLQGTPGDDQINGGGGTDIFRVAANRDEVTITPLADGTFAISHPDYGTDVLENVELIRFDDSVELLNPPSAPISQPISIPFNETAYLAQNPDVADAVEQGQFSSGFDHYTQWGMAEGRQVPMVAMDEQFYLSQNEDVALAVERGEFSSALEHYLLHGAAEGRSPNVLFDEQWYLDQNPDVAAGVLQGAFASAYEHFQVYGWNEGRNPSTWMDLKSYLADNEDVFLAGINPLDHFLNYGVHEGRTIKADDAGLWLA
ncbi:beta strand repeat-containing protein [Devosia naphthalenivorans]|uniref:beta strand repeat-containing protein n=1 Tax=Devosia naphthalenivorans TaxID=2082392 RepID=UPI000D389EBB|nr:hypothetical protein [Devosia naphthalenivorans]